MAINLDALSPKELEALIADAQSQMQTARVNHVKEVRAKIDALLASNRLSLADVYPVRGAKSTRSRSGAGPKYHNPQDPSQTWSGLGKRPRWFVEALKRRGVTPESLLIGAAANKPAAAPARAARKTVVKKAAPAKKRTAKSTVKRAAKG